MSICWGEEGIKFLILLKGFIFRRTGLWFSMHTVQFSLVFSLREIYFNFP